MTARSDSRPARRRAALLAATEPVRTVVSAGALAASLPVLRVAPRGEPHPVLVLPGLMASDLSTSALRRWLGRLGYPVVGWALGRNRGPTKEVTAELPALVARLAAEHGTPVTIVGWSLGGIFARRLARRTPRQVRQVITLGSPFRLRDGDRSAASHIADQVADTWRAEALRMSEAEQDKPPLPVPSTAVYSRTDGVVRWHTCIDTESELHENVEVRGSHSGLGFNPFVIYVVSDRLAQGEGDWRRFTAPVALRSHYPRPASWQPAD